MHQRCFKGSEINSNKSLAEGSGREYNGRLKAILSRWPEPINDQWCDAASSEEHDPTFLWPSDYYGGEESYEEVLLRDTEKKRLCKAHGIKMVYYAHLGIKYPYDVIEDPNLLIKAIRDRGVLEDLHLWTWQIQSCHWSFRMASVFHTWSRKLQRFANRLFV